MSTPSQQQRGNLFALRKLICGIFPSFLETHLVGLARNCRNAVRRVDAEDTSA